MTEYDGLGNFKVTRLRCLALGLLSLFHYSYLFVGRTICANFSTMRPTGLSVPSKLSFDAQLTDLVNICKKGSRDFKQVRFDSPQDKPAFEWVSKRELALRLVKDGAFVYTSSHFQSGAVKTLVWMEQKLHIPHNDHLEREGRGMCDLFMVRS